MIALENTQKSNRINDLLRNKPGTINDCYLKCQYLKLKNDDNENQ